MDDNYPACLSAGLSLHLPRSDGKSSHISAQTSFLLFVLRFISHRSSSAVNGHCVLPSPAALCRRTVTDGGDAVWIALAVANRTEDSLAEELYSG